MAFQHIRSGDLANLNNPTFGVSGSDALIPVKVTFIGTVGAQARPLAGVTITADRPGYPKGLVMTVPATSLISRTPSKGVSIPVWREEN